MQRHNDPEKREQEPEPQIQEGDGSDGTVAPDVAERSLSDEDLRMLRTIGWSIVAAGGLAVATAGVVAYRHFRP